MVEITFAGELNPVGMTLLFKRTEFADARNSTGKKELNNAMEQMHEVQ